MIYDKKIYEQFRINKPENVLKQYLYDYRYKQHDSDFNFLIGLCLLNMGYLHEAYVAFKKSVKCDTSNNRNKLFIAVTLLNARKYQEAKQYIRANIDYTHLNPSELAVFIDIQTRLNNSVATPIECMKNFYSKDNSLDNKIFLIYSLLFAKNGKHSKKTTKHLINSIDINDFESFDHYFEVLKEFYKLGIPNSYLSSLINKIDVCKLSEKETLKYLSVIYGIGYYTREYCKCLPETIHKIKKHFPNNENIAIKIDCMDYDYFEIGNHAKKMATCINNLKKYKSINQSEQGLLYIITYALKNNNVKSYNANIFKEQIEKLIQLDSNNIKYRRLYFEFLIQLGLIEQAKIVTEATLNLQKKKEKEEFELIKKFHSFYLPDEYCIFNESQEHHKEECPLCFGTEHMPIIKTIAFGHSPNEIFSDNVVRRKIEIDEKTLERIVDWQPMNIPSKIVGNYLQKLGAYTTTHDFPKVLIPGQTYIFIYLKNEAFRRLAKEGYSLEQIDPLYNIVKGINKCKLKDNSIFSTKDKAVNSYDNLVCADDFVIEVIKSITKEEEKKA